MKNASLTIGFIAGLTLGIILASFARADSDKCQAVSQAYSIAHSHYRSRTNLTPIGLYESEIAGIDLANDVSESYGVSCLILPLTKKKGKANG